ncbi:hypothetical protein CENSYa_1247 [Cenarchaeum symbiosum A]|uniref:Uncharacterized protein n=1 Tax=Cenarchaeum symbiosum (strain A) TaxID=414004 RepID=A0RX03_CENSY|nr:hypothetical protein CENSYa_1247 [Cenarchaeum symbiosum A]
MTVQLRMADDPTINRLVVMAIIIVLLVVAARVAVWVFHAADRHERHMKSLAV